MKRVLSFLLCICIVLSLAACSADRGNVPGEPTSAAQPPDSSAAAPDNTESLGGGSVIEPSDVEGENILIAYFTWAENTIVENPEAVDVDATTSASVLAPGNTAKLANWIQQRVGGTLFSITVTEPYSSYYDKCLDRAADEKAENARPELAGHIEDIDQYDVIFLGFPNWWYSVPMAIFSFIEEYDLSNKTIIPFCAHGTGGLASSVKDITAALPDSCEVLEPIGVYRPDIDSAQPAINEWLDTLGFAQEAVNEPSDDSERRLAMTVGEHTVYITLYNTPAANSLYELLPLELTFEDYNGIEKISYLTETLDTDGEPDGCDPAPGDLCLYAPWGNLSVFYDDFRYSDGLIPLGHVDIGMEILSEMDEDFTVMIAVVQ